ncbi:hypothetical protein ACJA28_03330 [Mesomycoplasma moatsii]|uniref:hypothetical protein n=1 Tax=Mesomycoplasma moatsii TaxID=171287 RepID=UPI0003B4B7BA
MDSSIYIRKKSNGYLIRGFFYLIAFILLVASFIVLTSRYSIDYILDKNGIITNDPFNGFYIFLAAMLLLNVITLIMSFVDAILILCRNYKNRKLDQQKIICGILGFFFYFIPIIIFGFLCKKELNDQKQEF